MHRFGLAFLLGLFLLGGLVPARVALGASDRSLVLEAGSGKVIRTARPVANLFAADPKVAEVRPASTTSVFVFGVAVGRTTVAAFDDAGDMIAEYDVVVRPSSYASSEANRISAATLPGGNVSFTPTANGLSVSGRVGSAAEAERAVAIGRGMLPKDQTVDNRLSVDMLTQVNLRVRFAEISRSVTRQLGLNWSALGHIGRIGVGALVPANLLATTAQASQLAVTSIDGRPANAILDALAEDNLVTILAEPNLTARSGETASFLAGGEFPVPVAGSSGGGFNNGGTISVEFKAYGISLAFVPTVLSSDRISIRVRPEVSQLTTTGAVSVPITSTATVTIPGLTVQRAETTVELGSGQTFAIAGLLSRNVTAQNTGLPYLGELPVLGPLFKSDSFQRDESELVILVTPYLVQPVSVASALRIPTDGYAPPNDIDRIFLNRQRARGTPDNNGHPLGDAGFLLN